LAAHGRKAPRRVLGLALVLTCAALVFYGQIGGILYALWDKTRVHGGNMRLDEGVAVLEMIGRDLPSALFGTGWGGTFQSPAVADIRVNFTHSLPSALLLKTGLIGFDRTVGFMLSGPLLISSLLYASYKSLDFGFLLLLIVVLGARRRD